MGTSLPPLQSSDFSTAFPSSRRVYVEEGRVRVPGREISLTNGESLRVYDTAGPQGCDVREGLPKLREPWVASRRGASGVTQLHFARTGVVTEEMEFVAIREGFEPEFVRS
ncbi:MAG: phosphomethylpyrimidine synthase ThiC, partial [Vicinamibacterales bacterium]